MKLGIIGGLIKPISPYKKKDTKPIETYKKSETEPQDSLQFPKNMSKKEKYAKLKTIQSREIRKKINSYKTESFGELPPLSPSRLKRYPVLAKIQINNKFVNKANEFDRSSKRAVISEPVSQFDEKMNERLYIKSQTLIDPGKYFLANKNKSVSSVVSRLIKQKRKHQYHILKKIDI